MERPTPPAEHAIAWPHLLRFTARLLAELREHWPPAFRHMLETNGLEHAAEPAARAVGLTLAKLERDLAAGDGQAVELVKHCADDVPVVRLGELRNALQALSLLVAELDELDEAGRRTVVRCVDRLKELVR